MINYPSTENENFRSTVEQWLKQNSEISCLIRYSHSAGNKSFEFFQSMETFSKRLKDLKPRTCITVFHDRQLPIRGRVNEQFISTVLEQIPDSVEYLITGLNESVIGKPRWFVFFAEEGHASLVSDLKDLMGEEVAVGVYPAWLLDGKKIISAIVPEVDGSVITGSY